MKEVFILCCGESLAFLTEEEKSYISENISFSVSSTIIVFDVFSKNKFWPDYHISTETNNGWRHPDTPSANSLSIDAVLDIVRTYKPKTKFYLAWWNYINFCKRRTEILDSLPRNKELCSLKNCHPSFDDELIKHRKRNGLWVPNFHTVNESAKNLSPDFFKGESLIIDDLNIFHCQVDHHNSTGFAESLNEPLFFDGDTWSAVNLALILHPDVKSIKMIGHDGGGSSHWWDFYEEEIKNADWYKLQKRRPNTPDCPVCNSGFITGEIAAEKKICNTDGMHTFPLYPSSSHFGFKGVSSDRKFVPSFPQDYLKEKGVNLYNCNKNSFFVKSGAMKYAPVIF